jgi:hypothetical protein
MNERDPLGLDRLFDKIEVELGHEDGRRHHWSIPIWVIALPITFVLTYVLTRVMA